VVRSLAAFVSIASLTVLAPSGITGCAAPTDAAESSPSSEAQTANAVEVVDTPASGESISDFQARMTRDYDNVISCPLTEDQAGLYLRHKKNAPYEQGWSLEVRSRDPVKDYRTTFYRNLMQGDTFERHPPKTSVQLYTGQLVKDGVSTRFALETTSNYQGIGMSYGGVSRKACQKH
jgi:hypothetical protein